ncbi:MULTISPECIES: 4Fe-4S dicluster domain-containing protein [Shewanella]|uniref:4Fe-4S dicluster domain-containing protein n=1 Tax=Shewanella TaxID=22 RepID=UPI001BBF0BAB|nr:MULTISPECIES: 4Fe-4S dicluster domain-containing protein [Shewanella]GIU54189.1 oxidoreductase [Shewanella sp. KT0246]
MTEQKCFVFRQENCVGCEACTVACQAGKDLNEFITLRDTSQGEKTNNQGKQIAVFLSQSCHHCADPVCVEKCPEGAMVQRADGIVYIDDSMCIGCGACKFACPYGAPKVDPNRGILSKCDMCKDRLAEGEKPYCVQGCPVQVLDVMDQSEALALPGASLSGDGHQDLGTGPSTVFIKLRN